MMSSLITDIAISTPMNPALHHKFTKHGSVFQILTKATTHERNHIILEPRTIMKELLTGIHATMLHLLLTDSSHMLPTHVGCNQCN